MTEDPWLTTEELAARLRMTVKTLHQWRYLGAGPRGTKFGRRVLYRLSDVVAWEHQREEAERKGA